MEGLDQADGTTSVINDRAAAMDAAETSTMVSEKKLLRKIDRCLLPLMIVSYMLQFLDKQSLSQSSIMGFIVDLKLTGTEYSWCGSIFYFGYLALSYPASLLMVRLPIGKYLAANFLIWGIILACHAATESFTGIMIARFFLGAAEAAVSPGFSMITGMWYKREEQPLRHGVWFAGNSIATAFGGLLAYGIAHITGSFAAWRWMYIIYGLITLLWSTALFLFLPDSPTKARFLNEAEGQVAENRLRVNQTGLNDNRIKWEQVWEALKDYKIWMLFFYQIANNIPNGGLTTVALWSREYPSSFFYNHHRSNDNSLIGCILVYATDNKGSRLFGLFIFVAYAAGMPLTLSMVSSNVSGYTKKATVSAMMFIAYCTGNIIGPFLFFADEAPKYESGFLAIMICFAVAIVLILALGLCWRLENAKRDRMYGPPTAVPVSYGKDGSVIELQETIDTTDVKNHSFRYVY
ncbi:pantothenate transporter [Penicillium odoratum]|uniref:pantothenate transporter n=1 Tax=Penicillium odoratum TaxID=1167516 RepID=UPI0025479211|nr:pantothenate transporter [Penicillium odoratum]KAJ5745459.1 pantothenate transporter [Penicillium odoratum]